MLSHIEQWLLGLAHDLPIPIFSFWGSLVEDLIAPIPSPLVTTLTGTLASAQGYTIWGIIFLGLCATMGKTIGCIVIYFLADKGEDFFFLKLGPRLGFNHEEIEKIGSRFSGGLKDYLTLTIIRAIPIIPALPVSVVAGIIKLPWKVYLVGTILGTMIRSMIFIILGYIGLNVFDNSIETVNKIESYVQIIILVALAFFIIWAYWKRYKRNLATKSID